MNHHIVLTTAPNPQQASFSAMEATFDLLTNPKLHWRSPETSVTANLRCVESQNIADLESVSQSVLQLQTTSSVFQRTNQSNSIMQPLVFQVFDRSEIKTLSDFHSS